jgi:deoxyribonuclease-4
MNNIIGLHIDSTPESLISEINKYNQVKIIQLFVTGAKTKKHFYDTIREKYKDKILFSVHISYIINIALDSSKYSWWINNFVEQIKIANHIGAFCVVVHLGKSLDLSVENALNNMYINLLKVHNMLGNISTKILIETSTGQGTELCYKLEDLAKFYNKFKLNSKLLNRFGICLDTCHIFNAGYDIRTKIGVSNYLTEFDKLIGIENIKLIHLNDSKNILGAKVDRHENLRKGFIGQEGLEQIILLFSKLNVPLVLETPDENLENDFKFINKLLNK